MVNPVDKAAQEAAKQQSEEDKKALGGTRSSRASNKSKGPVIRESKIIELMNTNKQAYLDAMQPGGELAKAYEENRVIYD